jgi:UDP-GlcNAc3NAcA epimerase
MKICTIIGARPQFVKAAVISAKIAEMKTDNAIEEVIIHTGQHYDPIMSDIFFTELKIPKEKYNLNVGSGAHGIQTGKMLEGIEAILLEEKPNFVLIYGDTNSTLAGALAAVKLHIPIAHVESGMRSFNRKMPEEINRIVADHTCTLNLCSTQTAVDNLNNEGLQRTAILTGDVMYDCALKFAHLAEKHSDPLSKFNLNSKEYILMTCHRAENSDNKKRMSQIIDAVNALAEDKIVLYPIHPRTKKILKEFNLYFSDKVKIIEPVGYLEMLILEKNASLILTDSGGVQKEAFFFNVPCVTMRDETEWTETVDLGFNIITGADTTNIIDAVSEFNNQGSLSIDSSPYGDGNSAEKILTAILEYHNER